MKKGAIPIPYIVALIFGVIIIALLSYWFTTQGGKTITTGEKAECDSKKYSFCIQWKTTGFKNENKPPGLGFDAIICTEPTKPACEGLIGGSSSSSCIDREPSCNSDEVDCGIGLLETRKCCKPSCP